jgi:rSAM/selenodomain-associated transferase 1
MAKSPRLGAVKRRLAAEIGGSEAIRFYRTCLAHTLMRLGTDPRWRTLLAVTPDRDVTEPFWQGGSWARIERLPQGHGDLGARMQALFVRLPPGPVVIVGSDIPGIGRADIAMAFSLLGSADVVLGPAQDGGYWLIGLKRRPRVARPFANVRWSSPHALADTLANLTGCRVAFAPTLRDVDGGGA